MSTDIIDAEIIPDTTDIAPYVAPAAGHKHEWYPARVGCLLRTCVDHAGFICITTGCKDVVDSVDEPFAYEEIYWQLFHQKWDLTG